jgi:Lon protease-like protein
MSAREIGLFPLAAVLVPGELMPLHIFEERYKRLIRDCEHESQEFAILYADDDGTREVGCTAEIVEVTERFDDGRLNLVVRGGEVVRVLELTRGRTYITGRVEPVADDDDDAAREAASALALYQQVAEATGNEPDPALTADLDRMSYAIAARVEFPAEEKLRLLEERSERARLMVIVELLARGLENLAAAAEIRDRAHTNGKVAPPGGSGAAPSTEGG